MQKTSPVYTTENGCQDCYKCVRHCPVKAIRIIGGKASVIPEACVSCGECVKVCPAHAKKIRSDLARLKDMLSSGAKVYASIAPSFTGYFKGVKIEQLAAALVRAGFAGVSGAWSRIGQCSYLSTSRSDIFSARDFERMSCSGRYDPKVFAEVCTVHFATAFSCSGSLSSA